jgi:hypothetical protein
MWICSHNIKDLKALEGPLWELENTAQEIGLIINHERKYIRISKKKQSV